MNRVAKCSVKGNIRNNHNKSVCVKTIYSDLMESVGSYLIFGFKRTNT